MKTLIGVSVAIFLGLMGAVSMAEAGRGGGGHGGGGGGHHGGGGSGHHGGGGHHHGGGGGGHHGGKHYGYGHYADRYRRHGYRYGWNRIPYGYYGGGCGWLYRNALNTGSAYWWNRYYDCISY